MSFANFPLERVSFDMAFIEEDKALINIGFIRGSWVLENDCPRFQK